MKYEEYYYTYLYRLKKVYLHWDIKSKGYPTFDLKDYGTIIWFTGDDRDSENLVAL